MRSPAAEVPRSPTPPERTLRRARYLGAVLGLLTAGLVATAIPSRPPKDPLPGFAAQNGLDLNRQILVFFLAIALPIAGGLVASAWARRRGDRRAAAVEKTPALPATSIGFRIATVAAHTLTLWIFVCSGFPQITGRLVWVFVGVFGVSAILAFLLHRGDPRFGILCLGAASSLLPLTLIGKRPMPLSREAAVAAVLLPFAAFGIARVLPAAASLWRVWTVGILLPGSITAFAAGAVLGTLPVADIFEDGHALLPASEYLRGELPYRDVVPGHGLLADGLFHTAGLKAFGDDYRGFARANKLLGLFFWPSFYAIGLAATGNPAAAFGIELFSFVMAPQFSFPRMIASAFTLALALFASRTGKPPVWLACGAAVVITFFITVDYAAYAAAGALTALAVSRGDRRRCALSAAAGAGSLAVAAGIALAAFGLLGPFVRTTFSFLPSLLPVYAKGFPPLPITPGAIDEAPAVPMPFFYGLIVLALILLGAELPSGARVSDRARAALPVLAWIVLSMLSVVERRHVGYVSLMVPTALALLARWFSRPGPARALRVLASSAAVGAAAISHHPVRLAEDATRLMQLPSSPPGAEPMAEPRRAQGAVFRRYDRRLVRKTAEMMQRAGFRDGDTWLDFSNAPGLYFLFDRPCPIRYYEPAFYESDEAQQEVIDAIEGNPRVRAALIIGSFAPVDGIENSIRAPRVDRYLRRHFKPFLVEDGIEYWLREPQDSRP
jgi:hypothetical protein